MDYLYTDDVKQFILCDFLYPPLHFQLNKTEWYGLVTLVINLMQVVYIQLNLFFFAYCSRVYRTTLLMIFQKPYFYIVKRIASIMRKYRAKGQRIEDARVSTTTQNTVFTIC